MKLSMRPECRTEQRMVLGLEAHPRQLQVLWFRLSQEPELSPFDTRAVFLKYLSTALSKVSVPEDLPDYFDEHHACKTSVVEEMMEQVMLGSENGFYKWTVGDLSYRAGYVAGIWVVKITDQYLN